MQSILHLQSFSAVLQLLNIVHILANSTDYQLLAGETYNNTAVSLIDLHQKSEKQLIEAGESASLLFFLWLEKGENPNYPDGVSDNTHFSPTGAKIMARLAVQGIIEEKPPNLQAHRLSNY